MKRYFNIYDEQIREEILNMPIRALGLKPEVERALKDIGSFVDFGKRSTIVTIRDLLVRGKEKITAMISREKYYKQNPSMIRNIEECLIKLGLTFADSEFTVYDVDQAQLKLQPKTREFVQMSCGHVDTIGDICVRSIREMKKCILDGDYSVLLDLKIALEAYGVKLVDANYDLDKAMAFPIKDYFRYLSPETRTEYLKNEPKPRKLIRTKERVFVELNKKINESDEPNS